MLQIRSGMLGHWFTPNEMDCKIVAGLNGEPWGRLYETIRDLMLAGF